MSLFQPKYKDKSGKVKKAAKWWIAFRGPTGTVHKWGLQTDSKDIAEIMESQLNSLTMWASKKMEPPKELVAWVQRQEPDFRQKIYDAGLLPPGKISETRTILELLEDYKQALEDNVGDAYAGMMIQQIKCVIEGCGFVFWSDVDGEKIHNYSKTRIEDNGNKKITCHRYVQAFRRFSKWLKKKKKVSNIPDIDSIKYTDAKRRSFEYDEYARLLETVKTQKIRQKLTGWQRYVLYKLAVETGLRLQELAKLTKNSFNFNKRTVTVYADETKSDKLACQFMTATTTALVNNLTENMKPDEQVFYLTNVAPNMIRADCKAAGIEVENHKGKIVFHSLRHTCATFLIDKGVSVKTVQTIMRHSAVEMTLKYYTHQLIGGVEAAVNLFENIEKQPKKRKQAS